MPSLKTKCAKLAFEQTLAVSVNSIQNPDAINLPGLQHDIRACPETFFDTTWAQYILSDVSRSY